MIEHRLCESRINAHPKHVAHDEVSILQVSNYTEICPLVCGLARQIAAEEQARADFVLLQPADQIVAGEWRVFTDAEREAKPAWIGAGRCLWQQKHIGIGIESGPQNAEVFLAALDEVRQLLNLRRAKRGLHIRDRKSTRLNSSHLGIS